MFADHFRFLLLLVVRVGVSSDYNTKKIGGCVEMVCGGGSWVDAEPRNSLYRWDKRRKPLKLDNKI